MTFEEMKDHLRTHTLYIVERSTSRTGLPNIASFYVMVDGVPLRIDNLIVMALGGDTRLVKVGRTLAASIHDPYLKTIEEHVADLSETLYDSSFKLDFVVI